MGWEWGGVRKTEEERIRETRRRVTDFCKKEEGPRKRYETKGS